MRLFFRYLSACHSREGGNPPFLGKKISLKILHLLHQRWIPAFAGMTNRVFDIIGYRYSVITFFLTLSLLICWTLPTNAALPVEEVTSTSGIKAWLVQDDKLPIISMSIAFRGGVEQDALDKQGLSVLASSMLTQGAGPYNASEFQKRLADNSISINFSAGRDNFNGEVKTLRSNRKEAFKLLRLALTRPRFDNESFERAKSQQLTQIRFMLGNPEWQARYALYSRIFKNHPYAMRSLGTISTLKNIKTNDLRIFAKKHFARDNLFIAVTGDISSEELKQVLDYIFKDLPEKSQLLPIEDHFNIQPSFVINIMREGTQTEMLFALPMPRRTNPDWYAATIANYILGGGGFSSRLMQNVRSKEGLTYGIGTGLASMERAALLIGNSSTDNDRTGKAWKLIKTVWNDFYENGVTDAEIKAAKDYLTGSMPLSLTSTSTISGTLLYMQLNNLGLHYLEEYNELIGKVNSADVARVIKLWFNPENLTIAMVGKPEGINATYNQEQVQE